MLVYHFILRNIFLNDVPHRQSFGCSKNTNILKFCMYYKPGRGGYLVRRKSILRWADNIKKNSGTYL